MKINTRKSSTALIASASAILAPALSHAAVVAAPNPGDVFLGFRASGGTGASSSIIVNVGNESLFLSSAPGSSVVVAELGTDLVNTYTSGWSDRSNLFWGAAGVFTSPSSTVYATRERTSPGNQTTPWATLNNTGRNGTANAISAVINGVNGYRTLESLTNSLAVLQPNAVSDDSWNYQVTRDGTDFGSLSQWSSIEGDFAGGSEGTVLDLYGFSFNGGTRYLGSFSINDGGTVTFTAVPEPSALLLGAASLSTAVFTRRRRVSNASL